MRIASLIRTRITSVLTTSALVVAGLAVTVVAAPAAAADLSPVADRTSSVVTTDPLPTVQIDGVVWDQTVVGNNVWAAGQFANARPAGAAAGTNLSPRNNLVTYNITTGAMITLATVPSLNAQVKTVAASPDGSRIYVGGTFTSANGANRYRIAAYNTTTGALITSFAPTINTTVNAIVATNTTVYVAGAFTSASGQSRGRLAAFSATNGAISTWAPMADAIVQALTLTPDGNLVVGGTFQNINGSPAYGLAKVSGVDGSLLPWNAPNLIRDAGAAAAILSLSTVGNTVYGTGYTFGSGGNLEGTFSADATTGNINWVEDCHGDTYDHYATAEVVYTVSHAHYCGNIGGFPQSNPWSINMRHALAFTATATGTAGHDPLGYYDYFGTPTPSLVNWFPDLSVGTYTGKAQAAWSVSGNGQYVVMGGEFPKVEGVAQQGLVRFAVSSIAPNKVGPDYTGSSFMPSLVGLPSLGVRVAWQANSDPDDHSLNYQITRNGTVVYTTTVTSTFWNRPTMGFIDTTAIPGTTYTYRLLATDPSGNVARSNNVSFTTPAAGIASAYAQRVVADGAAPYWPMNEPSGTVLLDNSGGFNDADTGTGLTRGTLPGAVAADAATTFDGATSTATRTAIAGPNTFTTQAWVKTTTTSGGKIVGFGAAQTGLSGSYDRMVYMDNGGKIFFGVYPNFVATVNSSASYNDGQWHQITATMGSDGMKLYVDGKLVGQRADVTNGQDYQGFWRVGGDSINGWPNQPASNYFAGAIDEVAIYPTVLTRQTVNAQWVASGRTSTIPAAPADAYGAAVFNDNPLLFWRLGEALGATAADASQNGDQTGVYENGVLLGAAGGIIGTADTAATFDGQDDVVASSNSYDNPTNYTEEAWFKTTSTNAGKIIGFGSAQNGDSGSYDRHVYMDQSGRVTFGVWTGQTNTITTAQALNDGKWHQVVATQSTTDGMKLYIDGVLAGTHPQTGAQPYPGYWRVGGDRHWTAGSAYLAATIDDVAVYGSVLNASQVANHFNLGNTVVAPNVAPTASFTATPTYLDAAFDATASVDPDGSIIGYAWNFGDNGTATGVTPTYHYATPGTYTVTLTVTDNRGETAVSTRSVIATAKPNTPPAATFSFTANKLAVAFDASATTDPDGTITGYAWDFGDTTVATGVTTSHTYGASGSYTVTLTATDNGGATTTTMQTVAVSAPVNQAPVASFTTSATQLSVTFNGSASSDADGTIAGYAWDFGDGGRSALASPTHVYATAGTYTVVLTVTDNLGASNSGSQPLQVTAPAANQAPSIGFQISPVGLTVNVESTSTDVDGTIVKYAWSFGDGATADTPSTTHTFTTAGVKSIVLTVTDNGGATATQTQSVTLTAPVPPNVAPTAAFTFTATGLQLSVDGAGSTDPDGTVTAYSWQFGDGSTDLVTTAAATHTYLANGTYPVVLTVTDNRGATSVVTQQVTVSTPVVAPLAADAFGRTTASGWGTADIGGGWTVAGGIANFSVAGGSGKIRMNAAGAAPTASLGALAGANVDIKVDVSLDKAATGGGTYVSVGARKVGNSEYRLKAWFKADGTVQLIVVKVVNGVSTTLRAVNVTGLRYVAGTTVTLRFQIVGDTSVALNSKIWQTASTEPAAWQVTSIDASAPLSATGGLAIYPYLSGTSTSGAVVSSFDNLAVTPIG